MDIEQRRQISSALFGNSFMLEVGAAIGRMSKDSFTQQDIAQALALDKSLVRTAVVRLRAATLLQPLPRDWPKRPYERVTSAAWELFVRLETELTEEA